MRRWKKSKGKLRQRNKFIRTINNWQQLGAFAFPGPTAEFRTNTNNSKAPNRFLWRLVCGISKDGKIIMIYPVKDRRDPVPRVVSEMMMEADSRGGIVGAAEHLGDLWCIVADDPVSYKRAKKTYAHRVWFEHYQKRRKDGESE